MQECFSFTSYMCIYRVKSGRFAYGGVTMCWCLYAVFWVNLAWFRQVFHGRSEDACTIHVLFVVNMLEYTKSETNTKGTRVACVANRQTHFVLNALACLEAVLILYNSLDNAIIVLLHEKIIFGWYCWPSSSFSRNWILYIAHKFLAITTWNCKIKLRWPSLKWDRETCPIGKGWKKKQKQITYFLIYESSYISYVY